MSHHPPVDCWPALVPHQAVLLAVVEPVACPASDSEALQDVGLHPDELINPLVAPPVQQLTP